MMTVLIYCIFAFFINRFRYEKFLSMIACHLLRHKDVIIKTSDIGQKISPTSENTIDLNVDVIEKFSVVYRTSKYFNLLHTMN